MGYWKNVSTIIEGKLYLGNLTAARSSRALAEKRITHILSVCGDPIPAEVPESGIRHMRINVRDIDYEDILIHLPYAVRWIDQAIRAGGVVLVHCVQGLSRSATVVAAYLMWSRRISATRAIEIVREGREQIWPNPGFQEQLVLFELCQYAPSLNEGIYVSWKMKLNQHLAMNGMI
ncbi:phosphatases II [Dendrothele bispora CBS 962.96]|uniref:protein-tyrosine-phosphatase n=1 Tax=Dendrothele bispora (strain CBS 962.96) TaxID=1314807 RepID=A0A4S8N007_DENBC|nr:phosphatases II [Dendrothele bispora CBS 962.96]